MITRLYSDDGVVMLRPLAMSDAAAHLAGQDIEFVTWLNGEEGTAESVERRLAEVDAAWAAGGPSFTFAIEVEGRLAGTITAETGMPALQPHQADIVYGLYPDVRGRGVATRAVLLVVSFLDQVPGITQAVVRVSPANPRSRAVAERAGFVPFAGPQGDGDDFEWLVTPVAPVA